MKKWLASLLIAATFTLPVEALSINSRGQVAMGAGGLPGSVDKQIIPDAMGPCWVTNDVIAYPAMSRPAIMLRNMGSGAVTEAAPRGANDLVCGGGVWAAWLAGYGLFTSTGFYLPEAGLIGVGPNGEVAYVPKRQVGLGVTVRERDGSEWQLSDGVVYDLQLLGDGKAIWTFGQRVFVRGIPMPQVAASKVWRPRVVSVGGELWVTYWTEEFGVILHTFDDASKGYVITPPGVNAFSHDAVALGGVIRNVSAFRAGELPEDLRVKDINVRTEPRVSFGATPNPNPNPDPTPDPNPDPNPTPQPPQLPIEIFNALKEVRAKYPTPLLDKGAAVINEVALKFPGWGLEAKPNGNNCPQPVTNIRVGCDIIRGPGDWGYDVLADQEGAGAVVRATAGPADPARFVKPAVVGPMPDPDPIPDPTPDPQIDELKKLVASLQSDIARLVERVTELQNKNNLLVEQQKADAVELERLRAEVATLNNKLANPCDLVNITGPGWVRSLFGVGCNAK